MQTKTFGETGIRVAAIGLGTTGMGTKAFHSQEYVRQRIYSLQLGMDLGMTFIDTASLYGNGFSEEVVGSALKGKRENCFLATKFYPNEEINSQEIQLGLEASLRRLQTDWIDLYQIHWPNPRVNYEKVFEVLEKYRESGAIRNFGICNFSPQETWDLAKSIPRISIVSNEIEFNLQNQMMGNAYLDSKVFSGAILAYSPLNQGRIVGSKTQAKLIEVLAEKYQATPSQVALAWILSFERIFPIVKAATQEHVKENAGAMALVLSNEDIQSLSDSSAEETVEVKPESIKLRGTPQRNPYLTLEEAIRNPLNLIPSPKILSESILRYGLRMPIRVLSLAGNKDSFEYELDSYDPFDQVKKYWAWKIAFPGKPIPVSIGKVFQ
ncbi:MAG: aldo/keto reductase [Nitrospirota bacterium]|nr:aldo/keto reductase [Nitrospirota bacterium]MDH5585755.1 aldo/keto reductase [Nitrospirota bacterium]MDH5773684.1 aldo/keto reductase [Nitrospirota bacterium]